ncbi:MAG: hypothetical protein KDA84_10315 [Planctomycetaceae bacterium]|nr:hypothetical protein [Planctomycetaceae bacterium]
MGFLQRFLKSTYREGDPSANTSSFLDLSEEELESHLGVARYGNFVLTDAIRPSYDLQVVPRAGYRHDVYQDRDSGVKIPVLMAAVSREHLLDVFFELLDPLGDEVDVVLETSHERNQGGHEDLYREHIDLPVLKSTLYDFEDLLLNDGCTGIAVLNPEIPLEIQFDEHKLLIAYGQELDGFEDVLGSYSLKRLDDLKFITEAEHVHSSSDEYYEQFEELRYRLGVES